MPLTGSLKTLLLRGLLAGVIAGLLAATVGHFVGGPHVDAAIALEEAMSAADGHPHEAEAGHSHGADAAHSPGDDTAHSHGDDAVVSRTGQKFGQFLALGLYGLALGAIFGAVAHYARRFTTLSGPALGLLLGVGGWAAVAAVPFFKYPANPPAVGDPDTINDRTLLWVAMVLLGIAAVGAGLSAFKALAGQLSTVRLIGGVLAFVAVTTVGYVLLPGVDEVSADFPPSLLWQFRVSSLAVSATLWAALGLGFAALTEFSDRTRTAERERVAAG